MHTMDRESFYSIKCLFIATAVLALLSGPSTEAAVDENTVAVWLFDEGTGDVAKDASGNGHDGEFAGKPKWVKAKFGGGLEFPGNDSGYVVVESTKKLELETLSIEAWVKVAEGTGEMAGHRLQTESRVRQSELRYLGACGSTCVAFGNRSKWSMWV